MANTKVPVTDEAPVIDADVLAILTGAKSAALEILAKMRKDYDEAKAIADAYKAKHDALVTTAKTLRRDFDDVAKIEQRGRKAGDKAEADTAE